MTNDAKGDWSAGEESDAFKLRNLVYIRPVPAGDVLEDFSDAFDGAPVEIDADSIIYSVHAENGERLALVGDRDLAFAAARQFEMTPVSVH